MCEVDIIIIVHDKKQKKVTTFESSNEFLINDAKTLVDGISLNLDTSYKIWERITYTADNYKNIKDNIKDEPIVEKTITDDFQEQIFKITTE